MRAICPVCFHHCALEEGQTGLCRARKNVGGRVVCDNYGKLTSMALDPVEKKPLARFYPGSYLLSVGSYGCNLRCPFCQNSDISMAGAEAETVFFPAEELVARARALQSRGNIGLAFTYNEPLVGYEYVRDCAELIHAAGMKNVLITNGTVCEGPLEELLPHIDAMNVDLKGFSQTFYDFVGGDFESVRRTIALSAPRCHVEVTTLVIPGENDTDEDMEAIGAWIASVDMSIPLHISRFFPRYRLCDRSPTPVQTIYRLRDIAAKHLRYVYTGNC